MSPASDGLSSRFVVGAEQIIHTGPGRTSWGRAWLPAARASWTHWAAGHTGGYIRGVRFDEEREVTLRVNGRAHVLAIEPRATLLDALRDRLGLTGTKMGCDRGECGACTVHVSGRRVLACMMLAVTVADAEVTTIEGLAVDGELHPLQRAFLDHDALQCGYCTPGQVMSAAALIAEGHTGSADEIRAWMSGNICRCAAYPQIVAALMEVAGEAAGGARAGR
jgi:xanthine dehydrogenase YagT iron-sulfur-binding subunit